MAFFDDLGKKISATGQSALQKTKDIAEISRLNSAISDLEKVVENNYNQVGRLYVALHPGDYEADFGGMIMSIADAEAKIRDMKDQIMALRGMVRCANCGAEVSAMSVYCDSCGAEMPRKKEVENLIRCEGCGEMVPRDKRFCTSCGRPIASVKPVVPATGGTCPNCGSELAGGSAFCTQCGYKL